MNAPKPTFHIGQKVKIVSDPVTGGLPVMRDSVLFWEVGTVESIQFTGGSADRANGTTREQATVAFKAVGRDTDRRLLLSVSYLKAAP